MKTKKILILNTENGIFSVPFKFEIHEFEGYEFPPLGEGYLLPSERIF